MIFNFKNLSAYGQSLKTTSTDVDELSKLISNLTAEQTLNVLSTKSLSKEQTVEILLNKGMVQSEAEAIATKIASASANGGATFSLKAYTVALWENIKAIGTWMLTNPVGWIIGIGVAIGGAVAAYNFFNETIEEQKEKISQLKTEYESIIQELDVLGDEIEKNTKRIYELRNLQSQGNITLIEQDELNKLVLANELLKEQSALIEDEKDEKGQKLAKSNRDTFTEEFGSNADLEAQYNTFGYSMYGANIMSGEDLSDKDLILSIDALYTGIADAVENGDDLTVQSLTEGQDYLISLLQGRSTAILTELLKYQETLSTYMNPDGSFDDPANQQLWDDIESWKQKVYKETGRAGEWNTIQLNLALNDGSLTNTQKEIQQKFLTGTLTEGDILQYNNLITSLENANLILGKGETVASVYLSYLNSIATSQEQVNSSTPDFSFSASNQDPIDNYQSSLSTLSDALNKIRDNSLTDSDMLDLLQAFPSLTNKTDTLSESIQILINDKLEALKNSLKATGASDEILALFDDITAKSSGLNLNNVLSTLKNTDNVIQTVNNEIAESGKISTDTIQTILSGYPDLEDAAYRYLQGKISEADLLALLKEQYETDLDNYRLYILQKKGEDGNFYKTLVSLMSEDLINKAKQYGIDFNNYKNLCEAKLALDKRYAQKKLILDRANAELNAGYEKVENTTGNTRVNAEYEAQELKRTQILAQKDLDGIQSIINGLDTTIDETVEFDTALNFKDVDTGKDTDKDKEEKQEIDWLEQSLKVLQNEVDKFQTALDDTHGIDNQLKAIDDLNGALKNLKDGYEEAYDNYENRYNTALNSLGKSGKSIKKKIESGKEFDLKEYSPETAKIIQAAIDAYNQMVETDNKIKSLDKEMADNENLEKSKLSQADYESQLETVNTLLDSQTLTTKEKNALLDRQLELQKSINEELRKQAIYNGDTETVNKLDAEDKNNSVQKKLNEIQNNRDENQKLIDKYNSQLEDTTLTVDEIEDINDKLQDAINNDFDYQMEAEIAGIDTKVWNKYITSLKKKYKETKMSDEKFIKKHIEEIANNFEDTDMSKIYQEELNSQAEHENTQYELRKTDRSNRIQMNDNDIQDINNDIEAQGGIGTKTQYEQMSALYKGNLEYWDKQKADAKAMLATTNEGTDAWYKWNNEIQESEDAIADCNQQIKECNISILKLPLNDVDDALEEIGKQISNIDDEISEKDTLISAATVILDDEIENNEILKEAIQDQISALQEENDLRQSNLELQKAEWELEKAKSQKTSKVYREGEGFVYEANADDIQTAQETYDNLMFEKKISLLEKQSESYDNEIDRLNGIKENWSNIPSNAQNIIDVNKATSYNPDFANKVLTGDESLLTSTSDSYLNLLQNKTTYEEQQDNYQMLQDEINDLIQKYEEETLTYEETRARISAALEAYYPEILSKYTTEDEVLNSIIEEKMTDATVTEETSALMLENYKVFFGEMTGIFDGLNDLLNKFASNTQEMVNSTSRSISSLRDALQSTINEVNSVTSGKNTGTGVLHGIATGTGTLGGFKNIGKSHSGMELGYLGESSTSQNKDNFKVLALEKLEPNELLRVVQKGEGIVTEGQINTVMSNFKNLAEVKIPTITPLQKQNTNQSLNFNGDIIVQSNGDVNTLAKAIKEQLPTQMIQQLYK